MSIQSSKELKLFLLTIFIIVSLPTFAQNTDYITDVQYFTTENGLSHREVNCIFQDRDGMTWIGTRNGLNRFDGYSFTHWLDKNHGVDLRNLDNIGQDDEGWLWLYRNKSIVFFHPQKEIFQTLEERFGKNHFLSNLKIRGSSHNLFSDAQDRIYINQGNSDVMYRYHSSEGFTTLRFPDTVNTAYVVLGEKESELYHLLEHYYFDEVNYETYIPNKIEGSVINYKKDKSGKKLFYNQSQFHKNKAFRKERLEIYYQYLTEKNIIDVKHRYRNFLYEKRNKLWIGTDFGFYIITIQKNKFEFIAAPFDEIAKIKTSTRGIFVDNNQILACFEADLGLARFDFLTKKWTNLKRMYYGRAVYFSDKDKLWIGSADDIWIWEKDIEFRNPQKINKNKLEQIWNFCPSAQFDNLLWAGARNNLYKINTVDDTIEKTVEVEPLVKWNSSIQCIIKDKKNKNWLWIGTSQGLLLFDEKNEKVIERYNWNKVGKNYLPTDYIHHLYQEDDGIYWLATPNGIIRWDRKTSNYRQITTESGLSNNVIYTIYPDDFGNLWMSSDNGIIKMNKETFAIQNFLPKDGIGQTEFNRVSHFEYRDTNNKQQLFFGGLDGITIFSPKDFQKESQVIKPVLTLLKYLQFSGNERITIDKTLEIQETNKIIIPPNDYIYELEVGLLNYEDVENNQYLYQLNSEKWEVQKKRIIQLGWLPYGSHQLKIKAKTINNTPSANILKFEIIVKRPFYLTWWFVTLTIFIIISFVFYIYNRRTKQFKKRQAELEFLVKERTAKIETDKQIIETDKRLIEQQAEELQQLDALKSRFFINVSHELRTPLTLILGPINTVLKRGDLTNRDFTMLIKAKESGKNLLQLVGSILDLSKMEANKMDLEETPNLLFPFIRRIISAFESHAQREGLEFFFEYQANEYLQLSFDKEKLETILNNLLSNAIKFTRKGGKITVIVKDKKNQIEISIQDTGQGIHAEDLPNVFNRFYQSTQKTAKTEGGTGIGLALSREFIQLMNGKIWVESEWNIGSQFFISFPRKEVLGKVDLLPESDKKKEYINEFSDEIFIDKSKQKILIVEDNYSLRDYIQTILKPHYNTITAANGQIAFDLLSQNNRNKIAQPDFILSDIMMPEMDGYELLKRLKSTDYLDKIPVVMLTARADIQDKLKALRIGVDDYLLKPFDEEELLTRISNLLSNYESRQAFLKIEEQDIDKINPVMIISNNDQEWLENVESLVLKEMNNSIFSNDYLAEKLLISPKTLYRKIKSLTGLTPIKYIRVIRLQQAKSLLENGNSVSETAYKVGFQKVDYFSKLFKKEFGKSPSEYK